LPFPTQHSARIRTPGQFKRIRQEKKGQNKFGSGIKIVWGVKDVDGKEKAIIQSIRFDKSKFTAGKARAWLKSHGYKPIKFEPALSQELFEELLLELSKRDKYSIWSQVRRIEEIDDLRVEYMWYEISNLYERIADGRETEYSEKEVLLMAEIVVKEVLARNKITFEFGQQDNEGSQELYLEVLGIIVDKKIKLENPHGDLVLQRKEKAVLLGENIELPDIYLMTQNGTALGYVRFGPLPNEENDPSKGAKFGTYRYRVDTKMFKETQELHHVSDEEKEARWPNRGFLFLYPIREFNSLKKSVKLK